MFLRGREHRAAGWLIIAVTGFLLLLNASFNGWDGGWTAVPRYLGPAIPFLVLPIATMWSRWPNATRLLAAGSMLLQLLLTAVDPQVPIGDFAISGVPAHAAWRLNPLSRYVVPLFIEGRAWPMLNDLVDEAVEYSEHEWAARGMSRAERAGESARLRAALRARVQHGDPTPFPLASVTGPVSANPIGIHEGGYYRLTAAASSTAAFNSFNLGELLFPQSRLSLIPGFVVAGSLVGLIVYSFCRPPAASAPMRASGGAAARSGGKPRRPRGRR